MMLNAGVPMATVSRIMRHASIQVTIDLYGHVSPDVARDAFDALGAAWAESAPTDKVTPKVTRRVETASDQPATASDLRRADSFWLRTSE